MERDQLGRLDDLYQRATQNGVQDMKILNADQIREIEPNCRVRGNIFRRMKSTYFFRVFVLCIVHIQGLLIMDYYVDILAKVSNNSVDRLS